MRHFAGAALRWLGASLDDTTEREVLLKRLSLVNVSPFPRAKERQPDRSANPWARPDDVPEPDPPFQFDYDFTRYQVEDLARVFGYAAWQVKDACVAWIEGGPAPFGLCTTAREPLAALTGIATIGGRCIPNVTDAVDTSPGTRSC